MKSLVHFSFAALLIALIIPQTALTQSDPILTYIHQIDPTIGVNRYLSRAVQAIHLNRLFLENPSSCSDNCNFPYYIVCNDASEWCIDNQNKALEALIDLQAAFIWRAVSDHNMPWLSISHDVPGNRYIESLERMISQINDKYDSEGLARPIVSATLSESRNGNSVDELKSLLNFSNSTGLGRVEIPSEIINAWTGCGDGCIDPNDPYYHSGSPVYFDAEMMMDTHYRDWSDRMDVSAELLEGRMYIHYLAKRYIDIGFTGLDMGQYFLYSKPETTNHFASLIKKIREYAESKIGANRVLIFGEGNPEFENPADVVDEYGNMIFDFSGMALRPREILISGQTTPDSRNILDWTCDPSNTSQDQAAIDFFQNSSFCNNETHRAYVDDCIVGGTIDNSGTRAPNGRSFLSGVPFLTYFDFGGNYHFCEDDNGMVYDWNNGICTPNWDCNQGYPGEGIFHNTWNMDDPVYFALGLDGESTDPMQTNIGIDYPDNGECKGEWYDFNYQNMRSFTNPYGYLPVLFYHNVRRPDLECPDFSNNGHIPWVEWFFAPDYLGYLPQAQMALDVFEPQNVQVIINERAIGDPYETVRPNCSGDGFLYEVQDVVYDIQVRNPSPSSTYSIHIQDASGNWYPYTLGSSRTFQVPEWFGGDFTIYIREDNLHKLLMPSGTRTFSYVRELREYICHEITNCENDPNHSENPNITERTNSTEE
ncbi:MAG: hypothetical protein AAGF87_09270 [Bacteroidota bacterium]